MTHFLSLVPYDEIPRVKSELPERGPAGGYVEPDRPLRWISERF